MKITNYSGCIIVGVVILLTIITGLSPDQYKMSIATYGGIITIPVLLILMAILSSKEYNK